MYITKICKNLFLLFCYFCGTEHGGSWCQGETFFEKIYFYKCNIIYDIILYNMIDKLGVEKERHEFVDLGR